MQRGIAFVLAGLLVGSLGCSDSTGPSSSHESIAGSYAGNLSGLSQGITLNATFSVNLTQNAGSLSGMWGLQGVLDDGINTVVVAGNGPLSGSIASGGSPSVALVIRNTACPNYQANFSGSYDSANGRLTVSGPIDFFGSNSCSVVLSYQATITLTR